MTAGRAHWWPAYVGLGSNLDDPVTQVRGALEELARLPDTLLVRSSRLYRSKPLDGSDQPDFINAVAALLTQLEPGTLLGALQAVEKRHGRRRSGRKWGARTLDLDLLAYAGRNINRDGLVVPHPRAAERNFVLLPLADLAPELELPGYGSVRQLLAALPAGKPAIETIDDNS